MRRKNRQIIHRGPVLLLTCWSWRISSLRSSTRLWSSRLSCESRSVPNSAFSDSRVDSMAWRLASRLWRLRCCSGRRRKSQTWVDCTNRLWVGNKLNSGHKMSTLGMNVFSDCCLFSFSIFISDRMLSLEALNFLCCVSICCIWFINWSISLLMRGGSH